ncbi:MAG: hypothetical protein EA401_03395 [Planctomycetota bacterium]|nr:MAG: hypothetical protein EA401_03395 [Planctomycetota bacterium]
MGGPFAVGGGHAGGENMLRRLLNTLYIEDPGTNDPSDVAVGRQGEVVHTAHTPQLKPDGSGALVGHMKTTNLNVSDHTRRVLSNFSAVSGATAVFVIADTSDNGHYWHYNAVDEINTITIEDNSFTVTGPHGSLRATVLYPSPVNLQQGILQRGSDFFFNGNRYSSNSFVNSFSDDGDHLVVMTVVEEGETHPSVRSISGHGVVDHRIAIGDLQVVIEDDDIRLGEGLSTRSIFMQPLLETLMPWVWKSDRGFMEIQDLQTIITGLDFREPTILKPSIKSDS